MPLHRPHLLSALMVLCCTAACTPADKPAVEGPVPATATAKPASPRDSAEQISRYIRCIFQDRDGNLWFGTTTDGVVRYDGKSLDYFNARNGFGSDWVNAIAQDVKGDLWFATRDGAVRYDGSSFARYTTANGLASDHIWCMLLDRNGGFWFGTYEGVSRFDGRSFTPFPIPAADLSTHPYYEDPKKINAIVEDKTGNIWFGTNGGGAYRYNVTQLTNFSVKDGLCDDIVGTMLVDNKGALWLGTRFGGLCTYDGTRFAKSGPHGENLNVLYQQPNGTLWSVVMYTGLCNNDGTHVNYFTEKDGVGIRVPFSVLEDALGHLWIGTGEGLYRYDGGAFSNITKADLLRVALR